METLLVRHTIDPIFDSRSRVLVLGTMPSPKSREIGFYYGHPQNRFWRVMEALFDLPDHSLIQNDARTEFLLSHHIALWDVLASCSIEGASDASIADATPNDIGRILDATSITHVFTTGDTAAKYARRFFGEELAQRGIGLTPLPSTSAANARMRLDDLVDAYMPLATAIGAATAKRALRKQVLGRRNALPPEVRIQKSREICTRLAQELDQRLSPDQQFTVAVYAPMNSEVDLGEFIQHAYAAQAQVAFPAMLSNLVDGQRMQMRLVSETDWRAGTAPFAANPIKPYEDVSRRFPAVSSSEIDLIVVPLVAFDTQNNRLGYGGGCYDRYLPALYPSTNIIGVAFNEQQAASVPTDEHDLPLPRIITA